MACATQLHLAGAARLAISARPRPLAPARRLTVVTHANAFTGASKYLSDAASQIFSPMKDDVPWERVAEPFAGKINHHEEVSRVRALAAEVRAAVSHLEGSVDELPAEADGPSEPAAEDYVTSAIDRIFAHNFTGDATEPAAYFSGGYRARARSQREVRRDINRLRRFESVLNTAIEKAEGAEK